MKRVCTLLLLLAPLGCDTNGEACQSDLDCYVGEACVLQTCLPQDEADADSPDAGDTDAPDPDDTDAPGDAPHPIAVSAGLQHTCALLSDQTVWCWGSNSGLALGQPEGTLRSLTPINVEGLEGAVQVVAGIGQTCARFEDGSVKCLGDSLGSGLGDGTTRSSERPVDVLIEDVLMLADASFHHCAIAGPDRTLTCWGANDSGQTGADDDPTLTPAPIAELDDIQFVAPGEEHTCVVTGANEVRCLGSNAASQRGIAPDDDVTASPNTVEGFVWDNSVVELVSGGRHTCALEADTTLRCWGDNSVGQLGHSAGEPMASAEPLIVETSLPLSGLAAGGQTTCGITEHGSVYCWGVNTYGELGTGDTAPHTGPVAVLDLSGALALTVGPGHSCALTDNEEIFCWGSNENGQLGNNSQRTISAPEFEVVPTWED